MGREGVGGGGIPAEARRSVDRIVEFTGCTREAALAELRAAGGDVSSAVNTLIDHPYEEVKTKAQKKKEANSSRDRRESERAGAIVGAPYGRGPGGAENGRPMRGNTHLGPRANGPPAHGGRANPGAQKPAQARGGALVPQRAQVQQAGAPQQSQGQPQGLQTKQQPKQTGGSASRAATGPAATSWAGIASKSPPRLVQPAPAQATSPAQEVPVQPVRDENTPPQQAAKGGTGSSPAQQTSAALYGLGEVAAQASQQQDQPGAWGGAGGQNSYVVPLAGKGPENPSTVAGAQQQQQQQHMVSMPAGLAGIGGSEDLSLQFGQFSLGASGLPEFGATGFDNFAGEDQAPQADKQGRQGGGGGSGDARTGYNYLTQQQMQTGAKGRDGSGQSRRGDRPTRKGQQQQAQQQQASQQQVQQQQQQAPQQQVQQQQAQQQLNPQAQAGQYPYAMPSPYGVDPQQFMGAYQGMDMMAGQQAGGVDPSSYYGAGASTLDAGGKKAEVSRDGKTQGKKDTAKPGAYGALGGAGGSRPGEEANPSTSTSASAAAQAAQLAAQMAGFAGTPGIPPGMAAQYGAMYAQYPYGMPQYPYMHSPYSPYPPAAGVGGGAYATQRAAGGAPTAAGMKGYTYGQPPAGGAGAYGSYLGASQGGASGGVDDAANGTAASASAAAASQYGGTGVEGLYPGQAGSAAPTGGKPPPGAQASAGGDSARASNTVEAGTPGAGQDPFYNMQGMFAGAGGYNSMQYVQAQYAQHVSQHAHQAASGNGL